MLKHPTKQYRWKKKKINVPVERKNRINAHVVIATIQTGYELCLIEKTINLSLMSIWSNTHTLPKHLLVWASSNCLLVACLTSQQHARVSQAQICSDNFACCHTEIEVADQTFHLTQSQYTDTGPTSPSTDPIAPGTWQGSHWSANF